MHFSRVLSVATFMVFSTVKALKDIVVTVGVDRFDPQYVISTESQLVIHWQFSNNTDQKVADSTFDSPCTGNSELPDNITYVFPGLQLWFSGTKSCKSGMVFAINPPEPAEETFLKFQKNAQLANVAV